jgi:hypothetical protein
MNTAISKEEKVNEIIRISGILTSQQTKSDSKNPKQELLKLSDSEIDGVLDAVVKTHKYITRLKMSGISMQLSIVDRKPINKSLISIDDVDYDGMPDKSITINCSQINNGNINIYTILPYRIDDIFDIRKISSSVIFEIEHLNTENLTHSEICDFISRMGMNTFFEQNFTDDKIVLKLSKNIPVIANNVIEQLVDCVNSSDIFNDVRADIAQSNRLSLLVNLIGIKRYMIEKEYGNIKSLGYANISIDKETYGMYMALVEYMSLLSKYNIECKQSISDTLSEILKERNWFIEGNTMKINKSHEDKLVKLYKEIQIDTYKAKIKARIKLKSIPRV